MSTEIERKFLLAGDSWRESVENSKRFQQGYLFTDDRVSVRVRIEGETANLNVKSGTSGLRRSEFEYSIPIADAEQMLRELCVSGVVVKTRHVVQVRNHLWEIDVFEGDNEGLVVAEVELQSADEAIEIPDWVGEEVTGEKRYYNAALAQNPFRNW